VSKLQLGFFDRAENRVLLNFAASIQFEAIFVRDNFEN